MGHDRARSFGQVAEQYARSRAPYPVEAVRWCLEGAERPVRRALDLGAGTGRLTQVLLGLGVATVAIEPDEQMRRHVPPPAAVLAGTAERVPLADGAVDAVLVGQAWHWFDEQRALAKVARVLRPGGVLGLLWNVFDDRVPWVARLVGLVGAADRLSAVRDEPLRHGEFLFERRQVPHGQPMTRALLADNVASRSGTVALAPAARAVLLEQARALAPGDRFPMPWLCDVWRGRQG